MYERNCLGRRPRKRLIMVVEAYRGIIGLTNKPGRSKWKPGKKAEYLGGGKK